jgi:hypothetical protein
MTKPPATRQGAEGSGGTEKGEGAYQPTPRECAMLVVHLIEEKDKETQRTQKTEKKVTRARLTDNALRRLCCRSNLTSSFLVEVQEWLIRAGWVLFFARTSYAIIKADHVDSWVRISTKRIEDDLKKVSRGRFEQEFAGLERVLIPQETRSPDDE